MLQVEHEVDVVEGGVRSVGDDGRLLLLRTTFERVAHAEQSGGDDRSRSPAAELVDGPLPRLVGVLVVALELGIVVHVPNVRTVGAYLRQVDEQRTDPTVTIGVLVVAALIGLALVSGGPATTLTPSASSSDRLTTVSARTPRRDDDDDQTTTTTTAAHRLRPRPRPSIPVRSRRPMTDRRRAAPPSTPACTACGRRSSRTGPSSRCRSSSRSAPTSR